MDISKYRPQFTIYTVDSNQERLTVLGDIIYEAGYASEYRFQDNSKALFELRKNPPHVVVYALSEDPAPKDILRDGQFVEEILKTAPETHIILVCSSEELDYGLAFYEKGVFDVLGLPLDGEIQLTAAVDRAIRIDYYNYLNEQLKEETSSLDVPSSDLFQLAQLRQWDQKLSKTSGLSDLVPLLMDDLHRHSNGKTVLYFKYIESRGTLVASYSCGVSFASVRGIGIDLLTGQDDFMRDQLFLPASIPKIKQMIHEVFSVDQFCAHSLVQYGKVKGVVVVLDVNQDFVADEYVKFVFNLAERYLDYIEVTNKYKRLNVYDEESGFYNRSTFMEVVQKEISRSRRIELPISLVIFHIHIRVKTGRYLDRSDGQIIFKMISAILKQNCRVYDQFGKFSENQVGLLLPHTGKRDAAIKAEKLRRILESANYSEIIPVIDSVKILGGVSEYPSVCADADELLSMADDALSSLDANSAGKVCLVKAKEGFVPDFFVAET
ncbi:MAG: diguanylate cyclase [Bdellovibrionales bacterium]|nr:diguanylate cyclase [Bdellovibrionales bacterium]